MLRRIAAVILSLAVVSHAQEHWIFLDNGKVRIGVNMDAGGSIGWFSRTQSGENFLNSFDHGRYVQQSWYGDADGSDWNGKPWRYNPVQGGSWKGVPATVLKSSATATTIGVVTRPRQWASGNEVPDMVFEETITLDGGLARLKFRMKYSGVKSHEPRHQELPAVFVSPRCDTLVFCEAGQPAWKNEPLTRKQPGFPNESVKFSERWAAWVDPAGQGIGIWFPHTDLATTYRVRNGNAGDCSYIAPIGKFALTPGFEFEYEAALAIGTVEEIRAAFAVLAAEKPAPPSP